MTEIPAHRRAIGPARHAVTTHDGPTAGSPAQARTDPEPDAAEAALDSARRSPLSAQAKKEQR